MIRSILIVLLFGSALVQGQTSDPLIYTVGKVFSDGPAHHAFVLWQPGDPAVTFGKEFAIYRKDGDVDSANPYARLGRTSLQSGPAVIHALLKLGGRFDHNAAMVADRINTLYADSISQPGTQPAPPAEPGLDEARKLAHLLGIAATEPKILQRLFFLGRAHPGVYLALGHGFAIKTDAASVQTYEVREVNAAGTDVRVIGRVTLDAANPTTLTRPSRPYEVFYTPNAPQHEAASARDHLVTRQRWGIPNDLRRLLPHTFGFNLYRVREDVAIGQGWHNPGTFPDTGRLENLVASSAGAPDPAAKRINMLPLLASALMTEAQAANLAADSETFFAHDDNDPPENPFVDGQTFYYFVAARDIAGHPGPVSQGTRIVICDRLPPPVPIISGVRNIFRTSVADLANQQGAQHFRLRIRQNPEAPVADAAANYRIYRWPDHTAHLRSANPNMNLVATLSHMPGQTHLDWDDSGAGAPTLTPGDNAQAGRTWWYTVRAEDGSACTIKNLSGHSPPVFGVLRDRVGPARPDGHVSRCRFIPEVICEPDPEVVLLAALGLPEDYPGFVARYIRRDSTIYGFDMEFVDTNLNPGEVLFKSSRFFTVPNVKDVAIPISPATLDGRVIRTRARSKTGLVGPWVDCRFEPRTVDQGAVLVFPIELKGREVCLPVLDLPPGDTPLPHDVLGPGGQIVGPNVTTTLPADTAEYRIYRRVGDAGAFELLERGSGNDLPNPLPGNIMFDDPAPPTEGGTEACYFVQVFDENGNSGPRVKIGCVTIQSGDLAVPMLAEATYLAQNAGQAQIRLNWFCDPVSAERFEIWCAAATAADPGVTSILIGLKLDTLPGALVNDDGALSFCGYQTKTIASGKIGSGAEFSTVLNVPSAQHLTFVVRAVGQGSYQNPPVDDDARPTGPFSNAIVANWAAPPAPNQPVIPWPALGLPGVADVELDVLKYQQGEGPFYAMPLPDGDSHASAILMGTYNSIEGGTFFNGGRDPLSIFFSFRKQNIHPVPADQLEPVLPFVVYRHQVPSEVYPAAVPNLVQVSPLLDRIGYKESGNGFRILRDPFFRFIPFNAISVGSPYYLPVGGTFSRNLQNAVIANPNQHANVPYLKDYDTMVCWVDPMPVARGASYQYLIVHFTPRGEIDRVIPTNVVKH